MLCSAGFTFMITDSLMLCDDADIFCNICIEAVEKYLSLIFFRFLHINLSK
jgi:hypothetical protein